MKTIVYSILIYFPLVFIYKIFGDYYNNYWVNYYWFVSSIFLMVIFYSIYKNFKSHPLIEKKHRRVLRSVVGYWGVMAALRLYLFFDIKKYKLLISSADKFTVGGIVIIIIFIYLLTALRCRQK